jgi:hypothetical protein
MYHCLSCMWLYAQKHLVSKYAMQKHPSPVPYIDVSHVGEYCVQYKIRRHRVVNNIHMFIFTGSVIYVQHFIFNTGYVNWMCWFCLHLCNVSLRMAIYSRNMASSCVWTICDFIQTVCICWHIWMIKVTIQNTNNIKFD